MILISFDHFVKFMHSFKLDGFNFSFVRKNSLSAKWSEIGNYFLAKHIVVCHSTPVHISEEEKKIRVNRENSCKISERQRS